MKALILAAGLGRRLKDYTKTVPKALVMAGGHPIIEYQLDALSSNGLDDVVIVIGHRGKTIRQFIESQRKYRGMNVTYVTNRDYRSTDSAYSFWLAKEEIKGQAYMHLNCDIVFSDALLRKVLSSPYENVIVLDKKIRLDSSMEQVVLDGDKIIKMDKTMLDNASGKAVGIAKLSPENIRWLERRIGKYVENGDLTRHFYGIIREAVAHIHFYVLDADNELLLEINTLEDLEKANSLLTKGYTN